MALEPAAAFGSVLTVSGAAAGVLSISGPGVTVDTIDVTSHSSTSGYREFVEGLADGGEITCEIIFDDANEAKWAALMRAGVVASCNITWPATTGTLVWTFSAFPTGFEPTAPVDGSLTATLTLKVTGAITYDTD